MLALTGIEAAAIRLQGQLLDTPCVAFKTLSQITGAEVFLKFENLQYTASFKERGACNKLAQLSVAEGLRAVIVMPRFTPCVKIERTRGFGAEVVLHGDTLDESRTHALGLTEREDLVFIHPYDDEAIVTGQGTVGLEMLRAVPDLDTLIVAVGGGGLIAGLATAAKAIKPGIEIIGVQTSRFPAMVNAIKGTHYPQGNNTIAEGIAVGRAAGLHPGGEIRVSARDVPGSLARITATVADAGANIDEVHHQRAFTMLAAQNVDIELVIRTRGRDHIGQVLAVLQAAGFEAMEQHG
mgnify:CR=1 FL=1